MGFFSKLFGLKTVTTKTLNSSTETNREIIQNSSADALEKLLNKNLLAEQNSSFILAEIISSHEVRNRFESEILPDLPEETQNLYRSGEIFSFSQKLTENLLSGHFANSEKYNSFLEDTKSLSQASKQTKHIKVEIEGIENGIYHTESALEKMAERPEAFAEFTSMKQKNQDSIKKSKEEISKLKIRQTEVGSNIENILSTKFSNYRLESESIVSKDYNDQSANFVQQNDLCTDSIDICVEEMDYLATRNNDLNEKNTLLEEKKENFKEKNFLVRVFSFSEKREIKNLEKEVNNMEGQIAENNKKIEILGKMLEPYKEIQEQMDSIVVNFKENHSQILTEDALKMHNSVKNFNEVDSSSKTSDTASVTSDITHETKLGDFTANKKLTSQLKLATKSIQNADKTGVSIDPHNLQGPSEKNDEIISH